MFKHAKCLTLALIALLHLSSAATRHPRSIWPWSSSETKAAVPQLEGDPIISDRHREIMEKANLSQFLDLNSHNLWKIHTYEGIDLRPVQLETVIVPSNQQQQQQQQPELPQLDARNPVSSVAPLTESQSEDESTEKPDLSFLDNLGGLAWFLPDPEPEEEENEKADAVADAIVNEENAHPGFFSKLWSSLWGYGSEINEKSKGPEVELEADDALVKISLPKARKHYANIEFIDTTLPQAVPEVQQIKESVQPLAHQQTEYAFTAGPAVAQPVTKWYKPNHQFSRSKVWIQSWNPNAAYTVNVQGPSDQPSEHVATVHALTADHFQRKVSEDEEVATVAAVEEKQVSEDEQPTEKLNNHSRRNIAEDAPQDRKSRSNYSENEKKVEEEETQSNVEKKQEEATDVSQSRASGNEKEEEKVAATSEGQVQQVAEQLESTTILSPTKRKNIRESIAKALGMKIFPSPVKVELTNLDQQLKLDDPKATKKAMDNLRQLQTQFESHKNKLGPLYPMVRRMIPN